MNCKLSTLAREVKCRNSGPSAAPESVKSYFELSIQNFLCKCTKSKKWMENLNTTGRFLVRLLATNFDIYFFCLSKVWKFQLITFGKLEFCYHLFIWQWISIQMLFKFLSFCLPVIKFKGLGNRDKIYLFMSWNRFAFACALSNWKYTKSSPNVIFVFTLVTISENISSSKFVWTLKIFSNQSNRFRALCLWRLLCPAYNCR